VANDGGTIRPVALVAYLSMTSRAKTPQQKKHESYANDRVEGGEYAHADRKNRPRVKARGQRQLRRASKQQIKIQDPEELQLASRASTRWLNSTVGLAEHLTQTNLRRVWRESHNLFRQGYGPNTHARFRAVIESWMAGATGHSVTLAEFYAEQLAVISGDDRSTARGIRRHTEFLSQFFANEPQLLIRFEKWISNLREKSA
jgi:hypothetical protein